MFWLLSKAICVPLALAISEVVDCLTHKKLPDSSYFARKKLSLVMSSGLETVISLAVPSPKTQLFTK